MIVFHRERPIAPSNPPDVFHGVGLVPAELGDRTPAWIVDAILGPARAAAPPQDVGHESDYVTACDRRGQPLLIRAELNGGLRALVPGGTRLADAPDVRDVPILWRYAYWTSIEDFGYAESPAFVIDTSLLNAVRRHRRHAQWIVNHATTQLEIIAGFVIRESFSEDVTAVHCRRALYTYLELEAATEFIRATEGKLPERTDRVLARVRGRLNCAALGGLAVLSTFEGDVKLRVPRRRRLGVRHWHGPALRLTMVLMKVYEVQRTLVERPDGEGLLERLRLLHGSLDYRQQSPGSALKPIQKLCDDAVERVTAQQWNHTRSRRLFLALEQESTRIINGVRIEDDPETARHRLRESMALAVS